MSSLQDSPHLTWIIRYSNKLTRSLIEALLPTSYQMSNTGPNTRGKVYITSLLIFTTVGSWVISFKILSRVLLYYKILADLDTSHSLSNYQNSLKLPNSPILTARGCVCNISLFPLGVVLISRSNWSSSNLVHFDKVSPLIVVLKS